MLEQIEFRFIESTVFQKEWSRLGYDEEDFIKLTNYLTDNPDAGDIITGTGGVKKLRWPAPGTRGKSGGLRVIYMAKDKRRTIYFIMVYSKSRQKNLTEAQKKILKSHVKQL
ncbi:MAG: type II toxin-antitoxin system RelE/ParE family toxin [Spirochaetaceae bacterium]|nr:type II toxin-antitoxin system RelE/ParE family toxin [Spirochaetaceae bacterium]MDT8296966.1 type II toxin-antitoxin system RelE/ParE family toxin [Spirochaetaceae bacterium]